MDDVVIRPFAPEDQAEVASLILGGLAEHWGDVDASLNPDVHDLATSHRAGRTVVAVRHGRIVGTGTIVPVGDRAAEVKRMSVDPDCRRAGVGRAIVAELLDLARQWDVDRVVLETSAHWESVVEFYLRCGFVLTHHEIGDFGRDAWFEHVL